MQVIDEGLSFRDTPDRITVAGFAAACTTLYFYLADKGEERVVVWRRAFFSIFRCVIGGLFVRFYARYSEDR